MFDKVKQYFSTMPQQSISLPKTLKISNTLPDIQLKTHHQAKRLKLKVSPTEIILVVPKSTSRAMIDNFLTQSLEWLEQTWATQHQNHNHHQTQLRLFHIAQPIQIQAQRQALLWHFDETSAILSVNELQRESAIRQFILHQAKQHLPAILREVAQEMNIKMAKISIRHAKTRWGSCNQRQDVMLNAYLVCCPLHLIRYVCIHELAHIVHFDHSPHFWQYVEQFDANYLQHREELKQIHINY